MEIFRSIETQQQTPLQQTKCLELTENGWRNTINTIKSISLLSCIRLHKESGCQGPYNDLAIESIADQDLKNALSVSSCPLEHKVRKTRGIKRYKKGPKRRKRIDYRPMWFFFNFLHPRFGVKFYHCVDPFFENPDNWCFYINKTKGDQKELYLEVMQKMLKFYENYTNLLIFYDLKDETEVRRHYYKVTELIDMALIFMRAHINKDDRGVKIFPKKLKKIEAGTWKEPERPWTKESVDIWQKIRDIMQKAIDYFETNPGTTTTTPIPPRSANDFFRYA